MPERVLSQVVRAVREARGLTQRELGALCVDDGHPRGRTKEAVTQWEAGRHPLSEGVLEMVASALGMTERELLLEGLGAAPPRVTERDKAALKQRAGAGAAKNLDVG